MALTISIEGKGVIANADASPDSAMVGSAWKEVGGGADSFTTDTFLYGTTSFAGAYSSKSGYQYYDIGAANVLDFDSGGTEEGQHIYMWIHCPTIGLLQTKANKGLTIRLGTDLDNNYREFLIAGSDDANGWNGGWKCFIIDPTKSGSVNDTGTFDVGAIRYFGVWIDASALAKGDNIFISQISVGGGLRVTGTSTSGWEDVVNYCTDYPNRAWGMFQEREGIYYSYGKTYIGDSTDQSAAVSFVDSGRIIQYGLSEYWDGSAWVTSADIDYAGIIIEDHISYSTTFRDGILVGSDAGRSGSTIVGNDNHDVVLDLYGGNNTSSVTTLYGTNLKDIHGDINSGDDTDHKFFGVAFVGCSQFDPIGSPVIRNCIFAEVIDSTGYDAALLWNDNIDVEDCSFIANEQAIQHDSTGDVTYTNLTFSGNDYDVLFLDTGTLSISVSGGTIPTYIAPNGGTVLLPSSVTLTMTVKDEAGAVVVGAFAYIDDNNITPFIMNTTTNASGIATVTHTGGAAPGSTWRIRKYGYKPYVQTIDIESSDISIPVTLISDPQQS